MCKKLFYIITTIINLNALYIILFFFLGCLTLSIFIYKYHLLYKASLINNKQKTHKMLNYLFINDIRIELGDLILLNLSTLGIYYLLRYLNFGRIIDIWLFNSNSLPIANIIPLILIFIVIIFYMKFLLIVIKYKFYKVYLYFKQFKLFDNIFDTLRIFHLTSLRYKEKSFIEDTLRKYFPHILLYITLLYDLKHKEIKILYYMLFIYSLIIMFRTLKKTFGEYDMLDIDEKLVNYFYKEKIHEKSLRASSEIKRLQILYKSSTGRVIYENYKEKIILYIDRGFCVDYIDVNFKKSYEPYNMRLLFIGIFILYITFLYGSLSWMFCLIITIPFISAICIYETSHKYTYTKHKLTISKLLIYILIIISIFIFIKIYLSKYSLHFITEHLSIFGYTIILTFSAEEKYDYFLKYIQYQLQTNPKYYLLEYYGDFVKVIQKSKMFFEDNVISMNISDINKLAIFLLDLSLEVEERYLVRETNAIIKCIKECLKEIEELQLQENIINKIYNKIFNFIKKEFDSETMLGLLIGIPAVIYQLYMKRNLVEEVLELEYLNKTKEIISIIIKVIRDFIG